MLTGPSWTWALVKPVCRSCTIRPGPTGQKISSQNLVLMSKGFRPALVQIPSTDPSAAAAKNHRRRRRGRRGRRGRRRRRRGRRGRRRRREGRRGRVQRHFHFCLNVFLRFLFFVFFNETQHAFKQFLKQIIRGFLLICNITLTEQKFLPGTVVGNQSSGTVPWGTVPGNHRREPSPGTVPGNRPQRVKGSLVSAASFLFLESV